MKKRIGDIIRYAFTGVHEGFLPACYTRYTHLLRAFSIFVGLHAAICSTAPSFALEYICIERKLRTYFIYDHAALRFYCDSFETFRKLEQPGWK